MKVIGRILFSVFTILITTTWCDAQSIRGCGTEHWMEESIQNNPGFNQQIDLPFRQFQNKIAARELSDLDCPILIPVHVIIVHPPGEAIGEGDNLSEAHIRSQIEALNNDFARLNADTLNTPPEFSVGDTGIRFCLASRDPEGNPTNGITRYATDLKYDFGESFTVRETRLQIKEATMWDREMYLNIWVAPTIEAGKDIIGFAKVPIGNRLPPANDDGVSIRTEVFGGPGYGRLDNFNLGRTTTHEVGHYLGLLHIWRTNGCSADDGIDDTPIQDDSNTGCPTHPTLSCGNEGDMFMNYMDYSYDACMNAFTVQQGAYMREIVKNVRSELLSAAALACPEEVEITVDIVEVNNASCANADDGSVLLDICGGGNEDYQLSVDGNSFTSGNLISNIKPGDHIITIKNLYDISTTVEVTISAPDALEIMNISTRQPLCKDSEAGSIAFSVVGGVVNSSEDYSYSIDGTTFVSSHEFNDLSEGIYTIYAKDLNGCTISQDVTITAPDALQLSVDQIIDVHCFGDDSGGVIVSGVGGKGDYTFSQDGINFNQGSSINNLSAGNYTIWIMDQNGCTSDTKIVIEEPSPLLLSPSVTEEILCFGENTGAISLAAAGGNGGYEYYINDQPLVDNFAPQLAAGEYTVKVKDIYNCESQAIVTISQPELLVLKEISKNDVLCAGDHTGSIEVIANGGQSPYDYYLNGQLQSESIFSGLNENNYNIHVIDANGCSTYLEEVIITNGELDVTLNKVITPSCSYSENGMIEVSGKGGGGQYTYSLDNENFQSEGRFTDLGADFHIIYVSDGNDCVAASVVDLRTLPPVKIKDIAIVTPQCAHTSDGEIHFEADGGSGNYSYKINGEVRENHITGLPSGDYIIEISDEGSCKFDTLISIPYSKTIDIDLIDILPERCNEDLEGSITVNASGGNGNLTYTLDNRSNNTGYFDNLRGDEYQLMVTDETGCFSTMKVEVPSLGRPDVQIEEIIPPTCFGVSDAAIVLETNDEINDYIYDLDGTTNSDGYFSSLAAGAYDIIVYSNPECITTITAEIPDAEKIDFSVEQDIEPTCNMSIDGRIDVSAEGGAGSFLYTLGNRTNATGVFGGLGKGEHLFIVTDENLCTSEFTVSLGAPERITTNQLDIVSPTCYGDDNGSINLITEGGTGLKTIQYNGNVFTDIITLENLTTGNYRFNITDENGCSARFDVFLDQPDSLEVIDLEVRPATAQVLGSITPKIIGGSHPYTFTGDGKLWERTSVIDGLISGEYQFEVHDANGCTLSFMAEVPYDDAFENPDGSLSEVSISQSRTTGETLVSYNSHGNQKINFYIYDARGRYIKFAQNNSNNGENLMMLPDQDLPSGIYFVRMVAEREQEYHPYVKL